MKKVLSVLLCVALLFSCVCVFAFAEGEQTTETVNVTFKKADGSTYKIVEVTKGQVVPVPPAPPAPARQDGDPEWEFDGWKAEDGTIYRSTVTLPAANEDTSYTAVFKKAHDNTDEGEITLMTFLSSIFSRLNKIIAQIGTYFEDLTNSISRMFEKMG